MSLLISGIASPGTPRRLAATVILAVIILVMAPPASAQASPGRSFADQNPTNSREVEAFLDKAMARQLEGYGIPGAAIAVVGDGRVLLAKGYGQADIGAEEPVAGQTPFKVASVSKLFTATAAMQLVEKGEIDLDEDVNTYLDGMQVPSTYPERPITLRHLLTHTAGFEERFTGSGARGGAGLNLGEYLAEEMPARVRPPGEVMAYSNYGVALAGHLVEEASGQPFERYTAENVFDPLGMENTTFAQPPEPELGEKLAVGYDVEDGKPVAGEFLGYPRDTPSAAAITTATDMAAFMNAHLQDGRFGDARILEETSTREMHERQFANDPRLNGTALGFEEQILNGERVVEHGGDQLQYHALVALMPERDVGIFVAYNSTGQGDDYAAYELVEMFMDHYYPEHGSAGAKTSGAKYLGDS